MSDKKPIVSVLMPNADVDELVAREAFEKGGARMGMSQYLLTLAIEKSLANAKGGGANGHASIDSRLADLRERQKDIPASAFKRGNRKRLFDHV